MVCAVIVTALVVRRELFTPSAAEGAITAESRTISDWHSYTDGQRLGPVQAKVTIIEFSDFECPFCKAMSGRLAAIRRKHPSEVALVYRHFPVAYHKNAAAAARASICAGAQNRFEALHDQLFAHQDSLGLIPWSVLAARAGVPDGAAFGACMSNPTSPAEITRDMEAGTRLGVQGTPTFLVNERLLRGATPGALEEAVERALASAG